LPTETFQGPYEIVKETLGVTIQGQNHGEGTQKKRRVKQGRQLKRQVLTLKVSKELAKKEWWGKQRTGMGSVRGRRKEGKVGSHLNRTGVKESPGREGGQPSLSEEGHCLTMEKMLGLGEQHKCKGGKNKTTERSTSQRYRKRGSWCTIGPFSKNAVVKGNSKANQRCRFLRT